MGAPCLSLQSSLELGLGIGLAMSNEKLYTIEGVDLYGRRIVGRYNQQDAEYLLASDCLNKLVKSSTNCGTINKSTNRLENK
jgi:hypothetical protein